MWLIRMIKLKYVLWTLFALAQIVVLFLIQIKFLNEPYDETLQQRQTCVHPELDLLEPKIMEQYYKIPPIKCPETFDWIEIKNGVISITSKAIKKYKDVTCNIQFLIWKNDFEVSFTSSIRIDQSSTTLLKEDFFKVQCDTHDAKAVYVNIHAGVSNKPEVLKRNTDQDSNGLGLDVLMIGLDSMSHMAYMRTLQKTYSYFTKNLQGIVLNGYNIVGDGTPQALIPILTGKTELELPRVLKRLESAPNVDVFPMIWKEFKNKGYITVFSEDWPHVGTFQYRMNGFSEPPTDFYMRPFHIAADKLFGRHECIGSKRRTQVIFDWLKEIYTVYSKQRKFVFSFYNEASHNDANRAQTADEDLVSTLKYLQEGGHLNNTLLILMSDHGSRYGKQRSHLQGKQEERRPFFGFAFPSEFRQTHPVAMRNFQINVNRLTSPFDIYPTFLDILNFKRNDVGNIKDRGISLFKEIPKNRSCADTGISAHWCACLNWKNIGRNAPLVNRAADVVIRRINEILLPHRKLCREVSLHNISRAMYLSPTNALLHFKRSYDTDGVHPDFSDETSISSTTYQLWLFTTPGDGRFEVTVKYNLLKDTFHVESKDISRINKYGDAPKCIEEEFPDIRKFCYCK